MCTKYWDYFLFGCNSSSQKDVIAKLMLKRIVVACVSDLFKMKNLIIILGELLVRKKIDKIFQNVESLEKKIIKRALGNEKVKDPSYQTISMISSHFKNQVNYASFLIIFLSFFL